jgi:hypothetical protein
MMVLLDLYCVFCDGRVMNRSHCVTCREYKGVVTLAEFIDITGQLPREKEEVK